MKKFKTKLLLLFQTTTRLLACCFFNFVIQTIIYHIANDEILLFTTKKPQKRKRNKTSTRSNHFDIFGDTRLLGKNYVHKSKYCSHLTIQRFVSSIVQCLSGFSESPLVRQVGTTVGRLDVQKARASPDFGAVRAG